MDLNDLSADQQAAYTGVMDWLKHGDTQIYYVAGYAGTGKTTIAKVIAQQIGEDGIAFMAFSGKAASVMRKKGCLNANTIHSWIYRPVEDEECLHCGFQFASSDLAAHVKACGSNPDRDPAASAVPYKKREARFELKEHLGEEWVNDGDRWVKEVPDIKLIVLDECSMVSEELGADLESFGLPILVFGDPGQLPPPKGTGYFTNYEPNILLDKIHRQAEGSPIIQLATMLRNKLLPRRGHYGEALVANRVGYDIFENLNAQILVGRNATRRSLNQQKRHRLGFTGVLPNVGEKLICLKNHRELKMFNGTFWWVKAIEWKEAETAWGKFMVAEAILVSDDDEAHEVEIILQGDSFTNPEGLDKLPPRAQMGWPFDFGYVVTVHKAQGSQWEDVVVIDEGFCWKREGTDYKWRYTAMTRASGQVVWLYT